MGRSCFAPGCKSGYNWNDGSKISTFSAPKDEHLFKLWGKAIPRSDLKLSHKSCLCELHFKPDDIIREHEVSVVINAVLLKLTGFHERDLC